MTASIRVEGHEEIINAFRNAGTTINLAGRGFLKNLSDYGVNQAHTHILSAGAVDLGELIGGIHYNIQQTGNGLQSTIRPSEAADKYAAAVEYGSRPHWPPIDALEGWASRHGIPAFLVARKIAMEGTEPRYFWRDTFEDLNKEVDSQLPDFADELARKL